MQYSLFKDKIEKENKRLNEMDLFHGSTEANLLKISENGFNRSYCGVNGTAYGQGVYFHINSSYPYKGFFSRANSLNEYCMIRSKVIVGESCIGNTTMKIPPQIFGTNFHYDSTTDPSRSIFVCYHDNQCFPEYLIYFTGQILYKK